MVLQEKVEVIAEGGATKLVGQPYSDALCFTLLMVTKLWTLLFRICSRTDKIVTKSICQRTQDLGVRGLMMCWRYVRTDRVK